MFYCIGYYEVCGLGSKVIGSIFRIKYMVWVLENT